MERTEATRMVEEAVESREKMERPDVWLRTKPLTALGLSLCVWTISFPWHLRWHEVCGSGPTGHPWLWSLLSECGQNFFHPHSKQLERVQMYVFCDPKCPSKDNSQLYHWRVFFFFSCRNALRSGSLEQRERGVQAHPIIPETSHHSVSEMLPDAAWLRAGTPLV